MKKNLKEFKIGMKDMMFQEKLIHIYYKEQEQVKILKNLL